MVQLKAYPDEGHMVCLTWACVPSRAIENIDENALFLPSRPDDMQAWWPLRAALKKAVRKDVPGIVTTMLVPSTDTLRDSWAVDGKLIHNYKSRRTNRRGAMSEEPTRKSRLKYLWPWVGMAAIIGLMWAIVAE